MLGKSGEGFDKLAQIIAAALRDDPRTDLGPIGESGSLWKMGPDAMGEGIYIYSRRAPY